MMRCGMRQEGARLLGRFVRQISTWQGAEAVQYVCMSQYQGRPMYSAQCQGRVVRRF
jgi:hypothetical protein